MATLQRIVGGGWISFGIDDASARQTITANSLGVDEQGGSPGSLPPRIPPSFSTSLDRIVGAGWWPIGISGGPDSYQRIAADSVLISNPFDGIIGLAIEIDVALGVSTGRSLGIGSAEERDVALGVTAVKGKYAEAGLATEQDVALAATPMRSYPAGLATETDLAFDVLAIKGKFGIAGTAIEQDIALGASSQRGTVIGLATERDIALDATAIRGKLIVAGIASEVDSALGVTSSKASSKGSGLAIEIDVALAVTSLKTEGWPFDDLKPRHIGIYPCVSPIGGGVALTGREPTVDSSAGYWRFVLGGFYIKTRDQVLLWRALEARFEGRGRAIALPLYDGKRAPWVTGAVGGAISAIANAAVPKDSIFIDINVTSAGTLIAGQHFSVGHRAYRITAISAPVGGVYTCTIWPKTREAIAAGAALEFRRPICRVRLEDDDGMKIPLHLLKRGEATVAFVEDL